jgi:hypothetical protein
METEDESENVHISITLSRTTFPVFHDGNVIRRS